MRLERPEARARRGEVSGVIGVSPGVERRPAAKGPPGGRLLRLALGAAILVLALQALAARRLELTFDEAYYVLWSRSLSLGYLDHPPMVAFMIRASTALFGQSELGVRALSLFLVGALPGLIAFIAWRLFRSVETAALAVVMWIAAPLILAGALFVTPDAPLVVFWTLGLAALAELWRSGKAGWLIAIGFALGLALQSKFTAAFFAAGVALAFVATPSLRRWLVSPMLAASLGIAVAVFTPFVAWNARHGWATFLKQLGRAPPHGLAPQYVVEFVASQIGLINPLVFVALVAAIASVSWRPRPAPGSPEEARRMLLSTIAPAAAYFLLHSLHDRVQGNWLAPLYPASAILAADWVARMLRAGAAGLKGAIARASLWAAPIGLAVAAVAYAQAITGFLPLGALDPAARIEGFRGLAGELDARARGEGAPFVLTQGYALTSLMTYYGDPSIAIVQPDERIRWIFEGELPADLFAGPGLALGDAGKDFAPELKLHFRTVEPAGVLERRRDGTVIAAYPLYRVAEPFRAVLDPI